ncbi:hypothetical protein SAMN05428936_101874 [Pelagibacterium halotolerans]|nr:hypothetical protein SAMN05428936_101874 [Pelagibacterium halotolerans]
MTREEWASLPTGFDPEYKVSNLGRVKRGRYFLDPHALSMRWFRKSGNKSAGYYLRMRQNGKRPYWAVADLVLLAFRPDFDATRHAVHFKDGDPCNARLSNLTFGPAEFQRIKKRIEALKSIAA